jgi:YbbR domain-containing protein
VQPNYVVIDNLRNIRVRVRGPRSLVAGTQAKDISAYVDMTNLSEGSHSIIVHSIIPPSLELIETTPEMALVRLEPIITRTMPVTVDFSGTLTKGLIIDKVNAKLNEAVIKGPKHIVDSVDKLIGKINITDKTSSFSVDAPIIPIGRTGVLAEGITVSPQVAFVEIIIQPDVVKKNLEVKPVFADSLPPGLTLTGFSLDPATVEVRENTSGSNILTTVEYIYTEPIKLSDINIETARTVKIDLPAGVTANPDSVKAIIKVGRIQERN